MNQRFGAVQTYLAKTQKALARGDATEHTYRAFLQELVQSLAKGISCINEPKGSKAGHPDLMVALGETPLGFIETKDIDLDLAEIAESAQLKRYRKSLPNLILTDYLDFRWFRNGSEMFSARLAVPTAKGRLRRTDDGEVQFLTLFDNFLAADVKTIGSPKELAARMAKLAQLVRRKIVEAFEAEAAGDELHAQLKAFREVLLPDLDITKFADMYAQTICYGLFAGKCNTAPGQAFCRDNAASFLPRTNPFLRKLFSSIMAGDLNDKVAGTIDAITFLLDHADIQAILADFGKRTRKEDPVVHFYETFLAEYDPKLRKSRGVYYTPEPVVSYIVRSVDWLLREKFGKKEGLADPSVLVLDPACGTGTFLYQVIQLIEERVKAKGQYGQWNTYVRDSLLPRIFGFELLMAPYAVAHLKLGLLLQETGYDFSSDERLGIYLTNTLEEAAKKSDILFAQWISDESNAASEIKKDKPVMVVLGNPPYSGISANMNDWIDGLLHGKLPGGTATSSYYTVDGEPLGERKTWLQDDYVKFIRWGQWRIDKTGSGILAFITNHAYLDNPTFRGMRQQLMSSFSAISLLNLHGNASRKEASPDGSKDENVFDIRQGVSIGVFVKGTTRQVVRYGDLWGSRAAKYGVLAATGTEQTHWSELKPVSPFYFFVPRSEAGGDEYASFVSLDQVLSRSVTGVVTARDGLVIDLEPEPLLQRMRLMADRSTSDEEVKTTLNLSENYAWRVAEARRAMRVEPVSASRVRPILYRPFDKRLIYYHPAVVWRTRSDIMSHLLAGRNIGLIYMRQVAMGQGYSHFGVSRDMVDNRAFYSNKGIMSFAPLYLYSGTGQKGQQRLDDTEASSWSPGKDGRVPNLNPKFVAEMEKKLGLTFVPEGAEGSLGCGSSAAALSAGSPVSGRKSGGKPPQSKSKGVFTPEDVFSYIYAVFHSPTYRKRYAEFLKIDFPRVPLTSDKKIFWKLVSLGRELVGLHLLESPKVDDFVTKYPVKGSDTVEKVWYVEPLTPSPQSSPSRGEEAKAKRGRSSIPSPLKGEGKGEGEPGKVHINADQYFSGVRPEEWEFHIGGYQVLQKWLKDRKGRKLTNDDIRHYQRVVVAIKETIRLMAEIDAAIPKWPMA